MIDRRTEAGDVLPCTYEHVDKLVNSDLGEG
jgi:hypothetical protein